jgi:hypothetical protein
MSSCIGVVFCQVIDFFFVSTGSVWNEVQYAEDEFYDVIEKEKQKWPGYCANADKIILALTEHQHLKSLIW